MLDFVNLYKKLKDQRYFSILIHSKPSPGLTEFAQKAAKAIDANYVNLHESFFRDEELANNIHTFTDQDFQKYIKQETSKNKPIILDQIDFLIDTWKRSEINSFINLFRRQWDTRNPQIKVPLIVFLESHSFLDDLSIEFGNGKSKIYKLSEFSAL